MRPPSRSPPPPPVAPFGPVLEIALLVWLTYKLAGLATERGRSWAWGGLGALAWLGGEGVGFAVGLAAGAGRGAALAGVACAALGAIAAYAFVRSLPRLPDDAQAP